MRIVTAEGLTLEPQTVAHAAEMYEVLSDVVVRSAKSFTSEDIHREIFPEGPPKKVPGDRIKASIGMLIRRRRGRV